MMFLMLFLSTPSARRATEHGFAHRGAGIISIHALREEGDTAPSGYYRGWFPISIHALREEGDYQPTAVRSRRNTISIHALREEGDLFRTRKGGENSISIHALREEGDFLAHSTLPKLVIFLSTPSARRATSCALPPCLLVRYFYPRPPRGGRLRVPRVLGRIQNISIHALREEGDSQIWANKQYLKKFLSTPSARRATAGQLALRRQLQNFYPRPPRGGRPSSKQP